MNIAEKIKEERGNKKLTRSELAREAGVSLQTIYNVEKGDHSPNSETLAKIAKALNINPATLWL